LADASDKSVLPCDEKLLEAFIQSHDETTFETIVRRHGSVVIGVRRRVLRNHHDAEDLVQEVFLNAYRSITRFRGESTFHTWLRRIMVNSFLSHKRRKEPPPSIEITEGTGFPAIGSDRTAFNNIVVQQVLQRLDEMPARQKLMFILKHQEGLTCEEIADNFGTSVGTVKKTLFRVVDRLRKEFHTPEIHVSEGRNARLSEIP
jgi:RNA polymerase sigma-70 factor (ECF subfamily)